MLEHLNFYERLLGPYPFRGEKYGVAETPHLGMKHQSIIAYGNNYKVGPHGYDWLHHYELGHEWWGNLVTAEDWRHLWIHEGLCTYMQALYAEEREGLMAYHHALYENRRHISNQHALVPEKPTGIEVMDREVGNDVYYKGAWVVHMLRYLIGTDQTQTVLRRFAYPTPEMEKLTDGSACRFVSTADFVQEAERVSNRDLDWFFDFYLNQPGILLLGEVIPKTMGVRYPDKIAPAITFPVSRFVNLVGPAHWIIRKIVDGTFRLARVNPEPPSSYLTEEDFKELIETSQRVGSLEEQEKHLIHRVFKFSDQAVRNIMTPRAAVFALPLSTRLKEAVEALRENRFSRIPVFEKSLDRVIGVLHAKELLRTWGQKSPDDRGLRPFLRKPHFVPQSKKLDVLFDPAVRCAVLTGQGPAFSAGSNIREFEVTTEWIEGARVQEVALNECIANSPVPVVAACNGVTLGGGAVMALACDVRVASASATFGFLEVKLGAMAGATGTQRLAQLVGPGHALRLMLTGRTVDAAEALRIGLVEEVVDAEALLPRSLQLAQEIAAVSPAAVRATKRCVRGGLAGGYAAGMRLEAEVTAPLGLTAHAIEGKAAFLEKRAPAF